MPRSKEWKEDLEIVMDRILKENMTKKKDIAQFLDNHVAKKNGLALSTVKRAYQKRKKEKEAEINSMETMHKPIEDNHVLKEEHSTLDQTSQYYNPEEKMMVDQLRDIQNEGLKSKSVPDYRYGEVVEVEVSAIVPYGVFVVTLDEHNYQGLIHITEVKDGYVSDLNDYFSVGDILPAKVRRMDPQGKLAFTTKNMDLTKIKKAEDENQLHAVSKNDNETSFTEDEREITEVVNYMNEIIGIVSPQAKEALKELIAKHGLFKFTMTLGKVAPTFEADIGKMLIKEVEKKIGDRL